MKTIITLTMNPAIDKSASVAQVSTERKLYCHSPRLSREDAERLYGQLLDEKQGGYSYDSKKTGGHRR